MKRYKSSHVRAVVLVLSGATSCSLVTACDPGAPLEKIGVTRDKSSIVIYYTPCEDERITRVRLLQEQGDDGDFENDLILWEIRSSKGVAMSAFTIGSTPSYFQEKVPFSGRASEEKVLTL